MVGCFHPTISSSVVPFPSCLQYFPTSMCFPMSWCFSFSINPSNGYSGLNSFRNDWLDLLAVQGTFKSLLQCNNSKASILQCSAFFMVQLSHQYITTGKTIALTIGTFLGKMMSLPFNMLSAVAAAAKSLQSCPTLCDPMNCSTLGFPVLHYLPEFAQTHVHRVGDVIQPSHLLPSPSLPALNLS